MHGHAAHPHQLARTHSSYSLRTATYTRTQVGAGPRASYIYRPLQQKKSADGRARLRKISGPGGRANKARSHLQGNVPSYVLQAGEAAVQARSRTRGSRNSGETRIGMTDNATVRLNAACHSVVLSAPLKEAGGHLGEDFATDVFLDEPERPIECQTGTSIAFRIWETQSVIDLLRPTDSATDDDGDIGMTASNISRRLVVAWKSASTLTRRLLGVGTNESAAKADEGGLTVSQGFDMVLPELDMSD